MENINTLTESQPILNKKGKSSRKIEQRKKQKAPPIVIFFQRLQNVFQHRRLLENGTGHRSSTAKKERKRHFQSPKSTSEIKGKDRKTKASAHHESSMFSTNTNFIQKKTKSTNSTNHEKELDSPSSSASYMKKNSLPSSPKETTEEKTPETALKRDVAKVVELVSNDNPLQAVWFKLQTIFEPHKDNQYACQKDREERNANQSTDQTQSLLREWKHDNFIDSQSNKNTESKPEPQATSRGPNNHHETKANENQTKSQGFHLSNIPKNDLERIEKVTNIIATDDPLKAIVWNVKRFFDQFQQKEENEEENEEKNEEISGGSVLIHRNHQFKSPSPPSRNNENSVNNEKDISPKLTKSSASTVQGLVPAPSLPAASPKKNDFEKFLQNLFQNIAKKPPNIIHDSEDDIYEIPDLSPISEPAIASITASNNITPKSKEKSDARRRRILESKKERMALLVSSEVQKIAQNAHISGTSLAGSAKLQQMRRRRFQKSTGLLMKSDSNMTINSKKESGKTKVDKSVDGTLMNKSTTLNVLSEDLLLKQHSDLSKYIRMVTVGVPSLSVIHKMKQDGISQDKIQKFGQQYDTQNNYANTNNNNTVTKSSPLAKNSFSLNSAILSQHIHKQQPLKVVIQSRRQNDTQKEETSKFSEIKQKPLPVNASLLAHHIKNRQKLQTRTKSKPEAQESVLNHVRKETKDISKENLKKDPELARYVRMASIGVPLESVLHKLHLDGISLTKVSLFRAAFEIPPVSSDAKPQSTRKDSGPSSTISLQKIHWNAIDSEESIQESLWASRNDGMEEHLEIDQAEIKQLETLFAKNSTPITVKKRQQSNASKKKKEISLITDRKRANNISISLAQYRVFPNYDKLCLAVTNQEQENLDAEKLQNMHLLLPTKEELRKIRCFKGSYEDLGKAEQFFYSVEKIPRFEQKLHAFEFSIIFPELYEELNVSLRLLKNACDEIMSSTKLATILKKLLAVGNIMNESVGGGKVVGIKLDSLVKTANKKGSDGKTTVLDHVVQTILKQEQSAAKDMVENVKGISLVDFWTEMPSVRECTRLDVNDCRIGFKELQDNVQKVERSIRSEKNEWGQKNKNLIFIERSTAFMGKIKEKMKDAEIILREVEKKNHSLFIFFAEDSKKNKASSIFQVLTDLAKLVDASKAHLNRQKRRKKKEKMEQKFISKKSKASKQGTSFV